MFLYNSVLTCYLIKMKNIFLVVFLLVSNFFAFGQEKVINNYKYIIVPERFPFLKQNDQFQTSSLTKFLLEKNGFTVVLDSEEYPIGLKNDVCKALTANVVDKSSMFKTTVLIEFKNCSKKVVYTTEEGDSKEKDYKKSFQEAIRDAHSNMSDIKYVPFPNLVLIDAIKEPVADASQSSIKIEVPPTILEKVSINNALKETNILYAQPNENGFQLINLKPKVVFLILNTNIKDFFIIKDKNGVLYKKDTTWFAEFYENGKLIEKKYQIKF